MTTIHMWLCACSTDAKEVSELMILNILNVCLFLIYGDRRCLFCKIRSSSAIVNPHEVGMPCLFCTPFIDMIIVDPKCLTKLATRFVILWIVGTTWYQLCYCTIRDFLICAYCSWNNGIYCILLSYWTPSIVWADFTSSEPCSLQQMPSSINVRSVSCF